MLKANDNAGMTTTDTLVRLIYRPSPLGCCRGSPRRGSARFVDLLLGLV